MNRNMASLILLCASFLLAPVAASAITITTVPVGNAGNAGNAADTAIMSTDNTSGYGSVAYAYRIGRTEVTNSQYAEFLNAKAAKRSAGALQHAHGKRCPRRDHARRRQP